MLELAGEERECREFHGALFVRAARRNGCCTAKRALPAKCDRLQAAPRSSQFPGGALAREVDRARSFRRTHSGLKLSPETPRMLIALACALLAAHYQRTVVAFQRAGFTHQKGAETGRLKQGADA